MKQNKTEYSISNLDNLISLLKYVKGSDTIHLDEVLKDNSTMEEMKQTIINQIIRESHPYAIYFSEKEQAWRTYLYDESKKYKRQAIKRTKRRDLEQFLITHYLNLKESQRQDCMLLQDAFSKWVLFKRDYGSVTNKTIYEYFNDWKKFFQSSDLAETKLKDFTPSLLIKYFRQLTKDRAYSYSRISGARAILNGIFSWAIENEVLDHNPITGVNFNSFTYKPEEKKIDDVFTIQEVRTLLTYLQTIPEDPYTLAIQLMFNLIARIGEVKGLRFEDVNWERRTIYIHRQVLLTNDLNDDLTFSARKVVEKGHIKGYTSSGYRLQPLTDQAIEILKKAKAQNPNGTYIFEPFGKPMLTDTFNERLKKYCKNCGIPPHSSHKIRFYCASMAYDGTNLAEVSKALGHSQVSTTLRYLRDIDQGDGISKAFERLGLH